MNEPGSTLPELEVKCDRCNGAAGQTERGQWYRCLACDGAGYLPTEAGKKVLALMRHNFKPMLNDATDGDY